MPSSSSSTLPGLHVAVHDALAVRRRKRRGDLIQDRRRSRRLERPRLEQGLDAAAAEEPHDEVGGIRLSPVVVERDDVRVLEPGDDLRLALEPAHEVRVVRELGWHRLDRDLASDLRLGRAVDDAERALADLLEQPVAAERLAFELEVGVLAKDPLVQRSELGGGIDAELVGQDLRAARKRREPRPAGPSGRGQASALPRAARASGGFG